MASFRVRFAAAVLALATAFVGRGAEPEARTLPAVSWSEPPYFAPFTVASGNTYTLLYTGTIQTRSDSFFGIFHASATREHERVVAAAQELFEAVRPLAERVGQSRAVVVALFDLAPGQDLRSADAFGIGYTRNPDGTWTRAPMNGTAPPALAPRTVPPPPRRDASTEAAARAAATAWLAEVDRGQYAKAWRAASPLLMARMSQAEFSQLAKRLRDGKGRVVERRRLSSLARTWVTGLPNGSYVAFDFASRFEGATVVVERVSTVLAEDGVWRVAGYAVF